MFLRGEDDLKASGGQIDIWLVTVCFSLVGKQKEVEVGDPVGCGGGRAREIKRMSG